MSEESSQASAVVAGILGRRSDDDSPSTTELAVAMVSKDVLELSLPSNGYAQTARFMIEKGLGGDAGELICAFSRLDDQLETGSDALTSDQRKARSLYLREAISIIESELEQGKHQGPSTIEVAVLAKLMVEREEEGIATKLIRRCGEVMSANDIDQYGEQNPYSMNRWTCINNDVREWLIAGLFKRLGFWNIWRLVRYLFLGDKKPEEAEAEADRQSKIEIIHAKLEELWRFPVNLDDPGSDRRKARETELVAELDKVDPENATPWCERTAPPDRRED